MSQIPQGFVLGFVLFLGMGFFYYYFKERAKREIRKEYLLSLLPKMLYEKFERGFDVFPLFSSEDSVNGEYFLRLLDPWAPGGYGERLVLIVEVFSREDKSWPWGTCSFYFRKRQGVWKAYRLDIGTGVLSPPRAVLSDELKRIAEALIYLQQFSIEGRRRSFRLGTLEGDELKEFEEWKQKCITRKTFTF